MCLEVTQQASSVWVSENLMINDRESFPLTVECGKNLVRYISIPPGTGKTGVICG